MGSFGRIFRKNDRLKPRRLTLVFLGQPRDSSMMKISAGMRSSICSLDTPYSCTVSIHTKLSDATRKLA